MIFRTILEIELLEGEVTSPSFLKHYNYLFKNKISVKEKVLCNMKSIDDLSFFLFRSQNTLDSWCAFFSCIYHILFHPVYLD